MSKEIWKDIPDYEGLYQVSNFGRVRSVKNYYLIRSLKIHNNGYKHITLTKDAHKRTISVHQLVAMAFLNHKPNGFNIVVDHIDNNPLNNHLDNLQLITQRENSSKDRKNKSSRFTGVHWSNARSKWISRIRKGKQRLVLGSFDCELEAHHAYQKALEQIS